MMNQGTLKAGQIIRSGRQLYRVDMVNECRARIVPLAKRRVALPGGAEFEAERGCTSIAPTACVEIVTDLEAERDRIELEEAEAELAAARAELAASERPADPAPAKPQAPRAAGAGWHPAPGAAPAFRDGTLAAAVWSCIAARPGQDTKAIVAAVRAEGAVAACVSRFHQAGLIVKKS